VFFFYPFYCMSGGWKRTLLTWAPVRKGENNRSFPGLSMSFFLWRCHRGVLFIGDNRIPGGDRRSGLEGFSGGGEGSCVVVMGVLVGGGGFLLELVACFFQSEWLEEEGKGVKAESSWILAAGGVGQCL